MTNAFKATLACAAVLAVAGADNANATPVYAFASLGLGNLTISGIPVTGASVTSTTSANYPGSASTSFQDVADPLQATSGPGLFPGQNTFTQALLPANVSSPAGTRSDAQATGSLSSSFATANFASEGKLVTGGNASSSSGTNTTISITPGTVTTINLTFQASANLSAVFQTTGDAAMASTNFNFQIFDVTTSSFVNITDNINAANSGAHIAPVGLNQSVTASTVGSPQNFTLSPSAFSYTANLAAGNAYQIIITDGTTETLAAATPEPSTWMLLTTGFGLLFARRRIPIS